MRARFLRPVAMAGLLWLVTVTSTLACQGPPIRMADVARDAYAIVEVTVLERHRHGVRVDYGFRVEQSIKGILPRRWHLHETRPSECGSYELAINGHYLLEVWPGGEFQAWKIGENGTVADFFAHEPQPETFDELVAQYRGLVGDPPNTNTSPVGTAAPVGDPVDTLPLAAGWLLPAGLGLVLACRRTRRPSAPGPRVHQA